MVKLHPKTKVLRGEHTREQSAVTVYYVIKDGHPIVTPSLENYALLLSWGLLFRNECVKICARGCTSVPYELQ